MNLMMITTACGDIPIRALMCSLSIYLAEEEAPTNIRLHILPMYLGSDFLLPPPSVPFPDLCSLFPLG